MTDYAPKHYRRRSNWLFNITATVVCGVAWIYLIYLCVEELAR